MRVVSKLQVGDTETVGKRRRFNQGPGVKDKLGMHPILFLCFLMTCKNRVVVVRINMLDEDFLGLLQGLHGGAKGVGCGAKGDDRVRRGRLLQQKAAF